MANKTQSLVEIGKFKDLQTLVALLNRAETGFSYRLQEVEDYKDYYLFIEDDSSASDYSCGMVCKIGLKAYALSEDVHKMVLGAYLRFKAQA